MFSGQLAQHLRPGSHSMRQPASMGLLWIWFLRLAQRFLKVGVLNLQSPWAQHPLPQPPQRQISWAPLPPPPPHTHTEGCQPHSPGKSCLSQSADVFSCVECQDRGLRKQLALKDTRRGPREDPCSLLHRGDSSGQHACLSTSQVSLCVCVCM